MYALNNRLRNTIFFISLFGLLAIWNIPNTIAARYVFEGLLLLSVMTASLPWGLFFKKSKLLLIFFAYVIIQTAFLSTDLKEALLNFKSEWMHFILFSWIGAGAGLLIARQGHKEILFYIGLAFSVPLLIHFVLFIIKAIEIGGIPQHYWGINKHHFELGFTALQASICLSVFLLFQTPTRLKKILASICLLLCITSPLLAMSRFGVAFVLLCLFFALALYFIFKRNGFRLKTKELILLLVAVLSVGALIKIGATIDPVRWSGLTSRALVGFYGDPQEVFCNGIEPLRDSLQSHGVAITPEIEKALDSVKDGDGARVMAARSGLSLIFEYPFGINGSRQAYQRAIQAECGKAPAIFISHTHNAWIDTSLAIGIPGAVLLLLVMLNYAYSGFHLRRFNQTINPFAVALLITACVWIVRGITDPTLRDQMLEMQAFMLAFLFAMALQTHSMNAARNQA